MISRIVVITLVLESLSSQNFDRELNADILSRLFNVNERRLSIYDQLVERFNGQVPENERHFYLATILIQRIIDIIGE